jgi:hypothetical protein
MKKQKDFAKAFTKLEEELCNEITKELARIGKKLTANNSTLEFFGYSTCSKLEITAFTKDGNVVSSWGTESILKNIKEDYIPIWDAISILTDLREIKASKKKRSKKFSS